MEPLLTVLVPGILGGLVLALILAGRPKRNPSAAVPSRPLEAPSPSLINMSRIKVEGIGGLGMVAAVVAVAIADPRIRLATMVALVAGGGLALVMIVMRRESGALPSGGEGPDDRSTLHLEGNRSAAPSDHRRPPDAGAPAGYVKSFA
jgi:hypothetical protein